MTITSRFITFTADALRAVARAALALADRLEPTSVTELKTASHGAEGPEGCVCPPQVDNEAPPTVIAPEGVDRWLAKSAANEPEPPAPANKRVDASHDAEGSEVRPDAPQAAQAAEEDASHDAEGSAPGGHFKPPAARRGGAAVDDDDDDDDEPVATEESELSRAMRIAEGPLAGRSIADMMREAEVAVPWGEVLRLMGVTSPTSSGLPETAAEAPLPPTVPAPSTIAAPELVPIVIDPNVPLTPAPSPVSRPHAGLDDAVKREHAINLALRLAADPNMTGHRTARPRLLALGITEDEMERRIAAKIEERQINLEKAMAAYGR